MSGNANHTNARNALASAELPTPCETVGMRTYLSGGVILDDPRDMERDAHGYPTPIQDHVVVTSWQQGDFETHFAEGHEKYREDVGLVLPSEVALRALRNTSHAKIPNNEYVERLKAARLAVLRERALLRAEEASRGLVSHVAQAI